jgi:energy-coupling factor transporter ATP-binding protein EcfA2
MSPTYRAAKNRSQGRGGWCALFRHPLRRDKDGKPQRVRKGLGTQDDDEADQLVEQLNRLLEDESYWTLTEKERAAREFDSRVVSIFYDDIEARVEDPLAARDSVIQLYGPEDGYSRVLFVGTTGAGKTTLLRQLIGTDPKKERFPSTSTAKTTVFDTEIVCAGGSYRAVVSFLSRERVRFYIEECVAAAVSAAAEGEDEKQVLRRLLEHSDQRFRLTYVLGTLRKEQQDELTDEEDEDAELVNEPEAVELKEDERKELESRLREFLDRVKELGATLADEVAGRLDINIDDLSSEERDAFLELMEDELRDNEKAQAIVDDIVDEVETKFALLKNGSIVPPSGWPKIWSYETEDRSEFIGTINRFSSNYAPNFGRLLTPIVQGMRVSGPFRPVWDSDGEIPRLVLIDGEGLGHTPESASSLPTSVTKRYEKVDAILLVDNAAQPMQAGAQAVLRSLAVSGHDSKLRIVFTHFDQMKGDNLPNQEAKKNHVTASLDNAISGLESALGSGAVRGLRRYLEGNTFFVSKIQEELSPRAGFTRNELTKLLEALLSVGKEMFFGEALPIYDTGNLVLGVRSATEQFNDYWRARLNLGFKLGVDAEHWTRVKALSRRFASQAEDQYDTLRPVADLIRLLSEHINPFITKPRGWKPYEPSEEEKQIVIDKVAREFFSRLHDLANRRLFMEHVAKWGEAFSRSGTGSTRVRARDIRGVYEEAAPVPGETPEPESAELLDDIRTMFKESAEAAKAEVI